MSEWQELQVKDLIEQGIIEKPLDGNHGEIHPKGEDFVASGIPFVMASDINGGKVDLESCKFITEQQASSLRKGFAKAGDVLLTHKASLGRTALVPRLDTDYIMLTPQVTYYRIKDKARLLNSYLKYYFDSPFFQDTLTNHGDAGSTRAYIGITAQHELPIILPPLPEQKAIASVLSSLDDKIDLLHRQNKTLEAMAETLFRQWFIEEAKEDWDEVTVSSLFEVRDGTHDSPKQSPIGYPLVTSKHIGDGVLDFDSCYLISSDDYDKVNARSKVETGDILLSMIGTLGRTYLECDEVNYAIKNIGLFKTSQNPVWKYFIYLWLNSVQGKQFVDEHKSGSTQEYLSLGSLRGIQLKSPPNDLLLIFNAKVDNWFKKIHANTKQIQTLENLRDTLLPKLMSGEVRVQYQTEQVA